MVSNPLEVNIFTIIDEAPQPTLQERLNFQRLSARCRSSGGWIIGESFDSRFDTEVGGFCQLVSQSSDNFRGDKSYSVESPPTFIRRQSVIVDYEDNGRQYSIAEAEGLSLLKPVLARLKQREADYALFLVKQYTEEAVSLEG